MFQQPGHGLLINLCCNRLQSSCKKHISSYFFFNLFHSLLRLSYFTRYETSDGSFRREEGGLVHVSDAPSLVVRGEYGYIDSNGKPYYMKYIADANGYQPNIDEDRTRFNDRRIIWLILYFITFYRSFIYSYYGKWTCTSLSWWTVHHYPHHLPRKIPVAYLNGTS